jgi:hypothetical protein
MVREEDIASAIVCGPNPERHRAAIQEFVDAGVSNVYVHQVGKDQAGFVEFYQREILPKFQLSLCDPMRGHTHPYGRASPWQTPARVRAEPEVGLRFSHCGKWFAQLWQR